MPEWISVKDRLPDRDCKVLGVVSSFGRAWVEFLIYSGMRNRFLLCQNISISYSCNEVTHWMPMPDLPGEAEENDT